MTAGPEQLTSESKIVEAPLSGGATVVDSKVFSRHTRRSNFKCGRSVYLGRELEE